MTSRTRQDPPIHKDADGMFAFRWRFPDGTRPSFKAETRTAAKELKRQCFERHAAWGNGPQPDELPTLLELVDQFFAQYVAEANSERTLRARLKYATDAFGGVRIDRLLPSAIGAWRARLPELSAWHIHKALSQVLNYAVDTEQLARNPARKVRNPEPKRRPILPFANWADVEAVADELLPRHRAIPIFGVGSGLRPEEWLAVERADIDWNEGAVTVRRVFVDGRFRSYGKTSRSLRRVPLAQNVLEALDALPPRLDTRLLFPPARGGDVIDLAAWRRHHWNAAVVSAGLEARTPYAMRHTYASFQIAAGIDRDTLARRMGTSVEQIEKTYFHLLPESASWERERAEQFYRRSIAEAEAQAEAEARAR